MSAGPVGAGGPACDGRASDDPSDAGAPDGRSSQRSRRRPGSRAPRTRCGSRPSRPPDPRAGVCAPAHRRQTRSNAIATEPPPPRHSVASPYRPCRRCSSWSSVATIRAPLAPIGWPSAIAPPLTLTLSQSKPSSRPSASVCAANASLISMRSNASIGSSIRSSRRRTPSTGREEQPLRRDLGLRVADDPGERLEPEPLDGPLAGDDRGRGAVGDPGRVAGRDRADRRGAAVLAVGQRERRLEPCERLHRGVAARPLVDGHDRLAAPARRGRSPAPSRRRTGRRRWRRSPSGGSRARTRPGRRG